MAEKNLDGSGLNEVWVRAAQLVKKFTGAVNLTKGDLQTQVDTKVEGKAISSSSAITTEGEYALDAREKNASVDGTLANQISNLNSNLGTKVGTDQISNPNILDNAWLNVNSRGKSEYNGRGYCIDRWSILNNSASDTVIVNEDGTITFQNNNESNIYLKQYISGIDDLSLNGYTFSVMDSTGKITVNTKHSGAFTEDGLFLLYDAGSNAAGIKLEPNCNVTIKALKVERGSISTLHLDSAPDVESERLKCMLSTADTTDTYANKGTYTEDLWNSTKTYVVGEYCIYNGSLWKCLVENSNTVPAESNTWTATSIGAELASIISKIDALSA